MEKYFVSGIDTGIGKTVATGWLAHRFAESGKRVITQKLIQTGCTGISEDIIEHRKIMGVGLFPEDEDFTTCKYVLKYPASPHLACAMENIVPDFDAINANTLRLAEKFNVVLVEGAGGLMVPLTEKFLTIDYIKKYGLPLMLVVSSRLGSLNHALLSLECARAAALKLAAIVYNTWPSAPREIEDSTRLYLKNYLASSYPDAEFLEMGRVEK